MATMTKLNNRDDVYFGNLAADGTLEFPLRRGNQWAKRVAVDARGTWGAGTLTAKATGDETNYVALTDGAGAAIEWVAADDLKQVLEGGFGPFHTGQLSLAGATAPDIDVTVSIDWGD